MNIKNKQAMLLASQVLKIVLAVIGIALLTYLLFALYNSNSNSQDLKDARATVDLISGIILKLRINSSYVGEALDITPNGWSLFSFVGSSTKPNICSGKDCLCICDEVYTVWGLLKDRQQKECDKNGVCLIVEDLQSFDEIPIEEGDGAFTSIEIKRSGKWIVVAKK
mgnify:CR=1 FL=1